MLSVVQGLWFCRRMSHAVLRQSSLSAPGVEHASLDANLAAYLLCLVGHVVHRQSLSQEQQLSLASKAVAVHKLLLQVSFPCRQLSDQGNQALA